jgi:hypothetical protein
MSYGVSFDEYWKLFTTQDQGMYYPFEGSYIYLKDEKNNYYDDIQIFTPKDMTAVYLHATTNGASTNTSSWDISSTSVANRCIALINGTKTSAVITSVDNSVLTTSNTTSLIGSSYVTSETSIAGSDSTTAVPNPIEVARSSSYTDAQKAVQDALLAATSSTIS